MMQQNNKINTASYPLQMSLILLTLSFALSLHGVGQSVSFTFDDGSLADKPGYTLEEWNSLLLEKLKRSGIKSILLVTGKGKEDGKGQYLLSSWNDDGHLIGNHSFSHLNYNSESTTIEDFKQEFIKNEAIIEGYSNYSKLFRFPYLKEGNTRKKVTAARSFLKHQGTENAYVTIDASDWYVDSRLIQRLRKDPNADISDFRDFYLKHIWERSQFYEKLAFEISGRHIKHTLLLHHNLAAALFIDELIKMYSDKGWEITSAAEAFDDPIYDKSPHYAGESFIYALAKDSGKYEHILRYPAEDSRYEKAKMDTLGL